MNARDAIAIEHHKAQRSQMLVDDWVVAACCIALAIVAIAWLVGALHPAPQVVSCYQPSSRP